MTIRGIVLSLVAGLIGCQSQTDETINVAVATNFYLTALALETAFESQTNYDVSVSSGSTGQLYAQIINGAPYDIFLAADQKRPEKLVEKGLAGERFTYAIGRLVLWSRGTETPDLDTLREGDFRHLAMANPRLAPYGLAAQEVVSALGISDKIIMGENIGQAYSLVQTGNAELGLVSLSQMRADTSSHWLVPSSLHTPIIQDAVFLKSGTKTPGAGAFYRFLTSDKARDIIEASGYNLSDGK